MKTRSLSTGLATRSTARCLWKLLRINFVALAFFFFLPLPQAHHNNAVVASGEMLRRCRLDNNKKKKKGILSCGLFVFFFCRLFLILLLLFLFPWKATRKCSFDYALLHFKSSVTRSSSTESGRLSRARQSEVHEKKKKERQTALLLVCGLPSVQRGVTRDSAQFFFLSFFTLCPAV